MKKFPKERKRLSKPIPFTKENLEKIPANVHGIYVIRDKDGEVMYVGCA